MASERMVRSGGTELFVRIDGEEGPWVVLLNSLAADLSMWEPQVAALAARYRVLRFDTRGHGRSSAPPPPYSIDGLVDDLLAVMRETGARPAHAVGLSLGGVVAAAAVLREPRSFASLAICDSRVAMPAEFRQGIDDRNRLVREKGMEAVVELFIERWFTRARRRRHDRKREAHDPRHERRGLHRLFRGVEGRRGTRAPRRESASLPSSSSVPRTRPCPAP